MSTLLYLLLVSLLMCSSMNAQMPKEFERVSGQRLARVSVGSSKYIWGTTEDGKVLFWNGMKWDQVKLPVLAKKLTGVRRTGQQNKTGTRKVKKQVHKIKYVSVGSDGTVWGIGGSHLTGGWNVFRRIQVTPENPTGRGWQKMRGRLTDVEVGSKDMIWGVRGATKVVRWDAKKNRWKVINTQSAMNISIGADKTLRALEGKPKALNFDVYARIGITDENPDGTKWEKVMGSVADISVGSANDIWAIAKEQKAGGLDRKLLKWDGTTWHPIKGHFRFVEAGSDGEVWFLGGKHTSGGWEVFRKKAGVELKLEKAPEEKVDMPSPMPTESTPDEPPVAVDPMPQFLMPAPPKQAVPAPAPPVAAPSVFMPPVKAVPPAPVAQRVPAPVGLPSVALPTQAPPVVAPPLPGVPPAPVGVPQVMPPAPPAPVPAPVTRVASPPFTPPPAQPVPAPGFVPPGGVPPFLPPTSIPPAVPPTPAPPIPESPFHKTPPATPPAAPATASPFHKTLTPGVPPAPAVFVPGRPQPVPASPFVPGHPTPMPGFTPPPPLPMPVSEGAKDSMPDVRRGGMSLI